MTIDIPRDQRGQEASPNRVAFAWTGRSLGLGVIVVVVILCLIGSIMILSASSVAATDGGSPFAQFIRQCVWLFLGMWTLVFAARIDHRRWERLAVPLLGAALVLMVAVLVPGVGREVNGARRWIAYGELGLQPSEFAKFALIVYLAHLLAKPRPDGDWRPVIGPALGALGGLVFLLYLQPNLGTTVIVCAIVGLVLVYSGAPMRFLSILGGVGVTGVLILAVTSDYRRARLTAFLHPEETASAEGYQIAESLIGVASGGVSGAGLGESRAKWGFLPEAHTDFVFSIVGEELGLVGSIVVVLLLAALIALGLMIAARAETVFARSLAVGFTAWFAVQAFINIGVVLALVPPTGVPLPFLSFGGTSLLATTAAAGVLVNIATRSQDPAGHGRTSRARGSARPGRTPRPGR